MTVTELIKKLQQVSDTWGGGPSDVQVVIFYPDAEYPLRVIEATSFSVYDTPTSLNDAKRMVRIIVE
jgi:hypothetical protein